MSNSSEKQLIELAAARSFLQEYNRAYETTYEIAYSADAPDIRCADSTGDELNIEITISDDREGDIQAALGRSDSRSINIAKATSEISRQSKASVFTMVSNFETDVVQRIADRIKEKLLKDYGANVVLVVYHKTGCQWSWDRGVCLIRHRVDLEANPYDKGIWILDWLGDDRYQIYRIDVPI